MLQPLHYTFRPVVSDQHTAARAYFLCIIGLLFIESTIRLPNCLPSWRKHANTPHSHHHHWKPRVWLHKFLTLPSPAPLLTDLGVASLIRLFAFVGLNLLWGWNRIRYTTDYKLYGWLTIANGGLALLLPTRNNLFSIITRIPAPVLLLYHRWAGVATVVHATLHFSLTVQNYIATDQLGAVLENARIRVGIMAWVALAVVFLTSLAIIRRRAFEVFAYAHFVFLVFVAGALYHSQGAPEFLLPGLGLWVVDRAWRCWNAFGRGKVQIQSVTLYAGGDGDVVKVRISGVQTVSPAQTAWILVPGVSRRDWHPFTIASAPGEKTATIAMRALGGYTQRLAQNLSNASVLRLDGPYGVQRIRWTRYRVVVLVAGGIGITPGVSIASHFIEEALRQSVSSGCRRVYLLWVVRDAKHLLWFEEELTGLAAALASRPDTDVSLKISLHVTGSSQEAKEQDVGGGNDRKYNGPGEVIHGRPDVVQWLGRINDVEVASDVAVNVCGPRRLKDDVRKAAASWSSEKGLFFVDEEVFEL